MAKTTKASKPPVRRSKDRVAKLDKLLRQRNAQVASLREQVASLKKQLAGAERSHLLWPTVLTEDLNVRQVKGEPRRRWFSDADLDLIVWLESAKTASPRKPLGPPQAKPGNSRMVQRLRSMHGMPGPEEAPQQDRIIGFQLCYDKQGAEKAFIWLEHGGYSHHAVNAGEEGGRFKKSPLLTTDGEFDLSKIAELFRQHSGGIDERITKFVYDTLTHI